MISFVPGSSNLLPTGPTTGTPAHASVPVPVPVPLDPFHKRQEEEKISKAFVFDVTEVANPFTLLLLCGGVFNVLKRKTKGRIDNRDMLKIASKAHKKNVLKQANTSNSASSRGSVTGYDVVLPSVASDDDEVKDMGDVEDVTDALLAPLIELEIDSGIDCERGDGRYYTLSRALNQFKESLVKGNVCSISSIGAGSGGDSGPGDSIGDKYNGSMSEDTVIIIIDNHLTFTTDIHTATLLLYIRYFVMNVLFQDMLSVSKDTSRYDEVLTKLIELCCYD